MKKSTTTGPTGFGWARSLRTFGHRNRAARLVSLLAAGAAAVTLAGVAPAYAVHDNGMFELDGNTVHNNANTPPYDWQSLFNASGAQIITPDPDNGPVLASTFIKDTTTPDKTYFASNKDIEPISAWGCGPINNPTDKDDLQNSYAALVQVPNNAPDNAGHKVLYLGSERDSNNGTSFAGFWLLKDNGVSCDPPSTVGSSASFNGGHTNGDILVVSDYTNGGGTQDVSVYQWVGGNTTNSTTANLQLIASGGVCSGSANDDVCAIANASTISTPWAPTSHDSNTFVETGIDMTNVLGSNGCFTTFMAETRSSAELTATLKDYAGGQFDTCPPAPITTTATPGGTVVSGSSQHDVATLSAVGGRPVPTGTVTFFLCQPSEVTAGVGCDTGDGTQVGDAVTVTAGSATSDSVDGTTTPADVDPGKYCWRAEYTPDADGALNYTANSHTNATTECFTVVKKWQPLTISKTADGAFGARYLWSINKEIAPTASGPWSDGTTPGSPLVKSVPAGANTNLYYRVTVREEGVETSTYVVSGTITVGNPNDAAVTATISESLSNCTLDGTSDSFPLVDVSVPAGGTTYDYTCDLGSGPVDPGTNTATVTWDKSTYPQTTDDITDTGNYSLQGSDDFTFAEATSIDKTVTITDNFHVFNPAWTITFGDDPSGVYHSAVYASALARPAAGSCSAVRTNTAKVTGDSSVLDQDSESGRICSPVVAPPLVEPPPPTALPNTGGPNAWLMAAGLILLLGGGTLVAGDRLRRRRS